MKGSARRKGVWVNAFVVVCFAIAAVAGIRAWASASPTEREAVRTRCDGLAYLTSSKGEGAFGGEGYRRAIYICLPTRLTSPSAIIVTSDPGNPVAVTTRSAWIPFLFVLILATFSSIQVLRYVLRKRVAA